MNSDETIIQAIGRFLDSVGEHLANKEPTEKQEILADLESHIYKALNSRARGNQPTLEDLQAVLAEMDAPESYAQPAETPKTVPANKRKMGIVALCICLGSLVLLGPSFFVRVTLHVTPIWSFYFPFLAGEITALVLGIIYRSDPYGKAAAIISAVLIALSILCLA